MTILGGGILLSAFYSYVLARWYFCLCAIKKMAILYRIAAPSYSMMIFIASACICNIVFLDTKNDFAPVFI